MCYIDFDIFLNIYVLHGTVFTRYGK